MGLKLLHTADLHLDRPFLALGPRRLARRAEMRVRFEELLRLAAERQVDALLIAGDLFDRPAAESGPWVKAHLSALADRGISIYLIPGNHDPLASCSFYREDFPSGIHVFRSAEPEVRLDLPGLALHGLAYRPEGRQQSPLASLARVEGARWQIGLIHGQLRSSGLIGEDYAPFTAAEIEAGGFDYLALGHYHGFFDCSAGRTKACYAGAPHRLDFGDTAERAALLVDLSENGVKVERIPLPDRVFRQIEGDPGQPEILHRQLIEATDPEVYLRVRLRGRTSVPVAGLVAELREKYAEKCFGFEVLEGEVSEGELPLQEGTVAHAFARRIRERLATAGGEEEAALLRLAADYGRLALEGRQLP